MYNSSHGFVIAECFLFKYNTVCKSLIGVYKSRVTAIYRDVYIVM